MIDIPKKYGTIKCNDFLFFKGSFNMKLNERKIFNPPTRRSETETSKSGPTHLGAAARGASNTRKRRKAKGGNNRK